MYYVIYSLYALFTTAVLSASFGVAVAISSFYLLFVASIVICWRFRGQFYLLVHEKLALALVAWLIFTTIIRSNALMGVGFVISEYRTLWMVPFIGFAISMVLTKKELMMPLIVGSALNWLGHFLLGLKNFGFPFSQYIGLVSAPGPTGWRQSLDGKFVQGITLTFWSGTWFAFSILSSKRGLFLLAITVLWIIAAYHGFMLVNTRSGLFVSMICISIIGFVIFSFKFQRNRAGIIGLLCLVVFAGTVINYGPRQIQIISNEAMQFFENQINANSSVGMRLQSLRSVSELKSEELVLGVGGGNWYSTMITWRDSEKISHYYLKWRDFHSEVVWLTILGGLVAIFFYLWIVGIIGVRSSQVLIRGDWFGGGLGIGIASVLLAFGLFNSIFTNVRESHLVGLALVVWSSWLRYVDFDSSRLEDHKSGFGKSRKPFTLRSKDQ